MAMTGVRAKRAAIALLACLWAWTWGGGALAQSPELERGRALYEARCNDCHDRSVHRREPRAAKTFAEIRSFVLRWDRELGALWRADELDAVTRYLNQRFYGYPCPASVCGSERAQADAVVRRLATP